MKAPPFRLFLSDLILTGKFYCLNFLYKKIEKIEKISSINTIYYTTKNIRKEEKGKLKNILDKNLREFF